MTIAALTALVGGIVGFVANRALGGRRRRSNDEVCPWCDDLNDPPEPR